MKYWNLKKINSSDSDKTSIVPRSINKLFEKFKKELSASAEVNVIEEFKVSKYQTVTSVKYMVFIMIMPILANQLSKYFIISPFINYFWNHNEYNIFLNDSQEERAFAELARFEEKLHFNILLGRISNLSSEIISNEIKKKALSIASKYAKESSGAVKNILADVFSITIFITILICSKRQFSILKSFINELVYYLSDTAKAFLIILFTDMFVGFHSPHGWEIILEAILRHLGLPENRDFIFIFISTFPVILDTIFKYWIFRYLNKISPSMVATYHNMNE